MPNIQNKKIPELARIATILLIFPIAYTKTAGLSSFLLVSIKNPATPNNK